MLHEKELQALKEQLEKEAGELEAGISRHKGTTDFGDDVESDFSEEADEAEEYANDLGVSDAFKQRLEDIEHALDKMTRGEYGKCEQCGKEIPLEVLKVDPESRLCKDCKMKK
ncbi:MAG: TraR/DksA C4-type zinc finger protein [Patescibacteria group bacterium]|nr:TraR/DksA C4-type zinc finger protein [Patescibacteria group bacterium]